MITLAGSSLVCSQEYGMGPKVMLLGDDCFILKSQATTLLSAVPCEMPGDSPPLCGSGLRLWQKGLLRDALLPCAEGVLFVSLQEVSAASPVRLIPGAEQ